jgi:hypothetical protein
MAQVIDLPYQNQKSKCHIKRGTLEILRTRVLLQLCILLEGVAKGDGQAIA